jgi:hypothetical protein
MPALRGITVAVGEWYARTLEICLIRNMRYMSECLVVTTPRDEAVKAVAMAVPGVRIYETEAFFQYGAAFNKGLSLEISFDVLGRYGMIMVIDSDIVLPDDMDLSALRPNALHGLRRRMLEDVTKWSPELDWRTCPYSRDGGPVGYAQIFDACDPAIRDKRPWYDVSFGHAGGGDAFFMDHWHPGNRHVLPIDVLHLGPKDRNWFGTTPEAKRIMDAFVIRNGWSQASAGRDRAAAAQVGEIVERVEVPGYEPSRYELPFVRRAKAQRAAGGSS